MVGADNEQVLLRQRKVMAEFGELALRSQDLDEILTEACRLVSGALGTHLAKFLEFSEDRKAVLLRNGVGWKPGLVGHLSLSVDEGTPEWYSLLKNASVVSPDISTEDRFCYRRFLIDHGGKAFINVLVKSRDEAMPYGIFEVDSTEPRDFSDSDVDFLRSYANLLAGAISRCRATDALEESERQLRESERHLRRSVELNPQLPWTADPEGRVISVDARWLAIAGANRDKCTGHEWKNLVHPDDIVQMMAVWERSVATLEPYDFQARFLNAAGEYIWFRTRAFSSLNEHGLCEQWYGTLEDISDRIQLEDALREWNGELEARIQDRTRQFEKSQGEHAAAEERLRQSQKMEAVGQLTGGIAHDFNNMLASVATSLELMQRRIDAGKFEKLSHYVTLAMTSVKRAAALTHRLLAFSRQQTLDPKPVQASQIIAGMEDLIRRTVGPSTIVETKLRANDTILCDPNQFENALLNLAINARDAMPAGGSLNIETRRHSIQGDVATERDLPPGEYIGVSVTDTGIGMTPEVLARAFDPFFTTKKSGEGTGLGLSMIYGFTQQSGGQARIHSQPGMGTTVTLYFRWHEQEALQSEIQATGTVRLPGAANNETILFVDDEVTVRQVACEVLRELGYRVVEAVDSKSALSQSQKLENVDLLIADIGLPGHINGIGLAEMVQKSHPKLKVLFITGFASSPILEQANQRPDAELLAKPFTLEELTIEIRNLLDRQND
ncbi:ATP-binding protein [Stutzerimonas tarimensis]|uniref:histidine kinase n=1 Tax=Stutzerimonas tarimensis TaxID=1507735 RepID=A0ABV7T2B7_9GAMM